MSAFATPGIYRQNLEPRHRPGLLARGDVAAILGYAARGPVMVPVRLQSLGQFEEVFGPALTQGFLWHGVKGFFECGGQAAYVVRLADDSARPAAVDLVALDIMGATVAGKGWQATASFPWPLVDPRRLESSERADTAIWRQRVEEEIRIGGPRRNDPGSWGNQLTLEISRTSLVNTDVQEVLEEGRAIRLASLAGVGANSVLVMEQTDSKGLRRSVTRHVTAVDPAFRLVRWATALDPDSFEPAISPADKPARITVTSVEFDVTVRLAGRTEQNFRQLAPHPWHARSLVKVMTEASRSLAITHDGDNDPDKIDWTLPANWPAEGYFALTGGRDGLAGVTGKTWDVGLAQLKRLHDAALIAAPDLTFPAAEPVPQSDLAGLSADCSNINPPAPGFLSGNVTTVEDDGTVVPVAGCAVDVRGVGGSTVTDVDGHFALSGIALELVELRLFQKGFALLETVAQASAFASAKPQDFVLQKLSDPATLPRDEILRLQHAMGNPDLVGPYKVAIVDPPQEAGDLEHLVSWRAELGDEPRLGLYAPWLSLPDPAAADGRKACPASAHICGCIARAELSGGIQSSGANLALRYVEGTELAIDDADQAGLNPIGINAIRAFPGRGIRAFGSRSLAADADWQFLTARRIVDAVEKTLERALAWMVFEPNSAVTRHALQTTTETFLDGLYRRGVLAGSGPEAAYRVKCDDENNPPEDSDQGRLILDVALAPTTPFEFIVFRIGQAFDAVQVTENTR